MNMANIDYVRHLFENMLSMWIFKGLAAFGVALFAYAIGLDKLALAEALFSLIMMDFVMAWIDAFKNGIPIQSSKVLRTGIKLAVYFMLAASAHLSESGTGLPLLDETVMGFLTFTELHSILEHASRIGFRVPKLLLNQLRESTK